MKFPAISAPLTALLMTLFSAQASAGTIDFIDLTEKTGGLGESSWSALTAADHPDLNLFGLNITGHATNDSVGDTAQFAYLDWGNAGLGVCKDADGAPSGSNTDSRANSCDPRSDDNVTVGEYLAFSFSEDVVVENLWFNNNHDGGFGSDDKVTIGVGNAIADLGAPAPEYIFAAALGYADGPNGIGSFAVNVGQKLFVAYNNEEFYLSGMQVSAVPVPAAVWLFGTAIAGLAGFRRRKIAA